MLRRTFRIAALPTAFLLLGSTRTARTQMPFNATFFANDTTINYALPSNGLPANYGAIIGYAGIDRTPYGSTFLGAASPTVNIVDGGYITGGVGAYNSSVVNITGGDVLSGVLAGDDSTINLSGGSHNGGVTAIGNGTVNFSGGSVGNGFLNGLMIRQNGTLNLSGGSFGWNISVWNSSTLNLFGTGLNATLVSQDYNSEHYTLFGILEDGSSITGKTLWLSLGEGAHFVFHDTGSGGGGSHSNAVPEASNVVLFGMMGVGSVGLLARKRVHRV